MFGNPIRRVEAGPAAAESVWRGSAGLRRLLAEVVMVLTVSASEVAAQEGMLSVIGAGTAPCGAWTAARRAKEAIGAEQWVVGYAVGTAEGYYAGAGRKDLNPLQRVHAQDVWAWIDDYCRDHPLERVKDAATAFVQAHPR